MRSLRNLCLLLVAMATFCASSGCDLTLGPKTKTVYVVVFPGKPLEVVEPATVKGRLLDGSGDAVVQDVGGWILMPPEHWEAVKRALEAKTK